MLLSHHRPAHYDRCLRIGGSHVCRRCAVLYPVAFLTAALSLGGFHWAISWDRALLLLLPLPVAAEFILERVGLVRYRAGRQMALTLLAGPALGRGFARYLDHAADRLFWTMVLLFGGSCLLALLLTAKKSR